LEDQIQKLKNQIINQEDKKEKVDTKKYEEDEKRNK